MKRCTYFLPKPLIEQLERQATKRILELQKGGKVGRKLLRPQCRDILCVLLKYHLAEVCDLSPKEFKKAAEEALYE